MKTAASRCFGYTGAAFELVGYGSSCQGKENEFEVYEIIATACTRFLWAGYKGILADINTADTITIMEFEPFEEERRFRQLWDSVTIERAVRYSLFTFGESQLPYYLILGAAKPGSTVSIRQGEVRIARPTIITPENMHPEFRNFFEENEEAGFVEFLMARTAAFSNLKLTNQSGPERIVSDSVEEAVAKLNHRLDDEEEDRVAILSAPPSLAGVALIKYASERVMSSASDNVQELRERGFL